MELKRGMRKRASFAYIYYIMYKFSEYITNKGYAKEQVVLSQLPHLDMVQQAQLDMSLHNDAIANKTFGSQSNKLANDKVWKQEFINIIQGNENNPSIIQQTIDNIKNDLASHQNRFSDNKTGSDAWHLAWINVYKKWIKVLQQKLGAFNGT